VKTEPAAGKKRKRWNRLIPLLVVASMLGVVYFLIPLPSRPFLGEASIVVMDENGEMLRAFLNTQEQWCLPMDPEQPIPEKVRQAFLCSEDRYFYFHPGVNPIAILRALVQNIRHGKIKSGGSTITMQLARRLKQKKRSYWHKVVEILQSIKIEIRYSKESILRLYLDHAPFGGNIIGVETAAWKYFGKSSAFLTWSEAAMLAVLPNAPGLVTPVLNRDRLMAKRNRLLEKMLGQKRIGLGTFQMAMHEPLVKNVSFFPSMAQHLCQELKEAHQGGSSLIYSTIRKELQKIGEEIVKRHMQQLSVQGIDNCSLLVLETASGKVRVYIGSQDFFDGKRQGQVNGVLARRSVGSTLKPFLYALSLDEGLITPEAQLRDVPTLYGAFSPENASGQYSGLVSAKEALIQSLNVPAVRLLYTYGLYEFYVFLQNAGLKNLYLSPYDYGLPLIVGGVEASLWEIVAMFRGLANGGRFTPLRVLAGEDSPPLPAPSLISSGACFLTLAMLREVKRPEAESYWHLFQNQWPIAWKTGTSFGRRDGWAIGVTPQWIIAVWVGNFNGKGSGNLTGAGCAAPLLFDIFNSLPKNPRQAWFQCPQGSMMSVEICLQTGYSAGPACENTIFAMLPKNAKSLKRCPMGNGRFVLSAGNRAITKESPVWSIHPKSSNICAKTGNFLPSHFPTKRTVRALLALVLWPFYILRITAGYGFPANLMELCKKSRFGRPICKEGKGCFGISTIVSTERAWESTNWH
jgi:penicillin-binding protein 1C